MFCFGVIFFIRVGCLVCGCCVLKVEMWYGEGGLGVREIRGLRDLFGVCLVCFLWVFFCCCLFSFFILERVFFGGVGRLVFLVFIWGCFCRVFFFWFLGRFRLDLVLFLEVYICW